MTYHHKTSLKLALPIAATGLLMGCVSQSSYDALQTQNQQLQTQMSMQSAEIAAVKGQVSRLQGAIKYTVNSDLLFSPGGWQMSPQGQRIIGTMATKLASTQQNNLVVNGYTDNTPVGAGLAAKGVTSNQDLSQKRADTVMQFLITQGMKPELLTAVGHGDSDPVASNDTAKKRAQNRRVELTLAGL